MITEVKVCQVNIFLWCNICELLFFYMKLDFLGLFLWNALFYTDFLHFASAYKFFNLCFIHFFTWFFSERKKTYCCLCCRFCTPHFSCSDKVVQKVKYQCRVNGSRRVKYQCRVKVKVLRVFQKRSCCNVHRDRFLRVLFKKLWKFLVKKFGV